MPLALVECDGETYTPDELKLHLAERADGQKYTVELASAMLAQVQERDYISTTTLTSKCLRQRHLERSVPYTQSLDTLWASFRGTMFHGQLELHEYPGTIAEARYHVDLPGMGHLSGSPDLVDPQRGYLYDYKFTKQNPSYDRMWADHNEQLQINRWLVDHADYVEYQSVPYDLTRDDGVLARFVPHDWQGLIIVYMDDKGPKPLRAWKSIKEPGQTRGKRVADIWSDDQVEELIYERYALAQQALDEGVLPDPPLGWEHQSHALCQYCSVRPECAALEFQKAVEQAASDG